MTTPPESRLWTYAELAELESNGRLDIGSDHATFVDAGHRFRFPKTVLRNAREFVKQNPSALGHTVAIDWIGPVQS